MAAVAGRAGGIATLTFDDGFANVLTGLVLFLHELGVPATVFVVSGWLGGAHPLRTAPSHPIRRRAQGAPRTRRRGWRAHAHPSELD